MAQLVTLMIASRPILNFGIRHGVATNVLLAVVTERLHITYLPGDVFREVPSLSNDLFSQSFPPASLSFASFETSAAHRSNWSCGTHLSKPS